jgi:hypothetical protein
VRTVSIRVVALVALAAALPAAQRRPKAKGPEEGFKVQCAGGTIAIGSSKLFSRLTLTDASELVYVCGKTEFRTPYSRIETVEYGQSVSRRYAAAVLISPILLLSKERRHFVTLGFVDERGAQQAMVFRVDKTDIRPLLAGLEARTGRRIEYQDDEARKGSAK